MFDKKIWSKKYYLDNIEKLKKYKKEYYKNNFKKMREKEKQWRKNNPEYMKEYQVQYRKNNREKIKEEKRQYMNKKRKTDFKFNLNHRISREIYMSLKGKKNYKKWGDLVGYSLIDLIKRLKSTMPKGYNWGDYLKGKLHIDHIIPISAFNFDNSENIDFKKCWSINNLRLLPAKENIIKHNKLDRPFQLAFKI